MLAMSKNSNNSILKNAYDIYASWLKLYPNPSNIPQNIRTDFDDDSKAYHDALTNFTIANNAFNNYMWSMTLTTKPKPNNTVEVCIEVPTYNATNIITQEVKQFSTSCLPDGWVKIIYITSTPTATINVTINATPSPTPTNSPLPTTSPTPIITYTSSPSPTPISCEYITTWGRNEATGEIKEFPIACLPNGWVRIVLTTPAPTSTPIPTATPNSSIITDSINIANAIPINADSQLTPIIKNILRNIKDVNTLKNISEVNVKYANIIPYICGIGALGCIDPTNNIIYISNLSVYNISDLDGSYYWIQQTFEYTLYHEIGHANYWSYNKYIDYSYMDYLFRPTEMYANGFANQYSKRRDDTQQYRTITRNIDQANTIDEEILYTSILIDYINQTVISTNDYNASLAPTSAPTLSSTPTPTVTPTSSPTATPVTTETQLVSFLWITDAHCGVVLSNGNINSCGGITESIDKADKNNIAMMVDTGDLIDGTNSSTIRDIEIITTNKKRCYDIFTFNCYYVLGNHDLYNIDESTWISHTLEVNGIKSTTYAIENDKIRFIILNTTEESVSDISNWLKGYLETDRDIVIFNHKPLNGSSVFRDIIKDTNVRAVFSGDNHQNTHVTIDSIDYFTQAAMRDGAYSFVNITNKYLKIDGFKTTIGSTKADSYNISLVQSPLNSLEISIPQLELIPLLPIFVFNTSNIPEIIHI